VEEVNENKKALVAELSAREKEIDKLKNKLKNIKDDEDGQKHKITELEIQISTIPELHEEIENLKQEISNLNNEIQGKSQEIEDLQNGLTNIQNVLDESQQSQEMISKKYDSEIKRLRNDLEAMTRKNETLREYKSKYEEMEKIYTDNQKLVKHLDLQCRASEQEKNEIKQESSALLKKLKNDAIYKDSMVDKRVINKFLISYFDLNTTYHVKLQILETLSSVLGFTEEEKEKVGLHKLRLERRLSDENFKLQEDGYLRSPKTPKTPKSLNGERETLSKQFLDFLMEEEEEDVK